MPIEGTNIPQSISDNYREFRAISVSPTDSNEPEADVVHDIDCCQYGTEFIPKGTVRTTSGPQVDVVDPGTNE